MTLRIKYALFLLCLYSPLTVDRLSKLGIKVEGVDLPKTMTSSSTSPALSVKTVPSIFLVGMRGSGKSHIGKLAAHTLSLPLLDFDVELARVLQQPLREFVHKHGWTDFRKAETALLLDLIKSHSHGWIISLGGGIVETPEARAALRKYAASGGCVVWIQREVEVIESYLAVETERPAYGESVRAVFERRVPWFDECANYIFDNHSLVPGTALSSEVQSGALDAEIARFFGHVSGLRPNFVPDDGNRSYFLALTCPDVTQAFADIPAVTTGVDAVELRVDLLREEGSQLPSAAFVASQVFALRRATTLPVIFTVRTVSQGGAFPDGAQSEAEKLLKLASRLGVEYIDIETTLPASLIEGILASKGSSRTIASFHDWSGSITWNSSTMKARYEAAAQIGDIVKLVGKASHMSDNLALQNFVAQRAHASKPLIALNIGVAGQLSRVLNKTLTPVTHPLLPTAAAPGQLSVADIHRAMHLIGSLPARRFFLLGHPIARSPSPTLHNTGLGVLGLPHTYALLEGKTITDEMRRVFADPTFGGASVTIPLKLDVIPLLDSLTPAAAAIGAVNTIISCQSSTPGVKNTLLGDNTDYLGIVHSIRAASPGMHGSFSAFVIGAGGTARAAVYALNTLGATRIYIYNRTQIKAHAIADAFPGLPVRVLGELGDWPADAPVPSVVISTVPADVTSMEPVDGKIHLTRNVFDPSVRGVVLDMAYKPSETPLLTLAKCTAPTWATVRGVEVLLEQGYAQFERWTARRCPREAVRAKVLEWYDD